MNELLFFVLGAIIGLLFVPALLFFAKINKELKIKNIKQSNEK